MKSKICTIKPQRQEYYISSSSHLCVLLGVCKVARSLTNLAHEQHGTIQVELDLPSSARGMDTRLVVVPDPDHRDRCRLLQVCSMGSVEEAAEGKGEEEEKRGGGGGRKREEGKERGNEGEGGNGKKQYR